MSCEPQELARTAAQAADSKLAHDLTVLDVSAITDVCECLVICTGQTGRQVDAIVDEIRERIHTTYDISPLSCEGRQGLSWVLLDYGSLVVHVFQPEAREFYRLETLWPDAPVLSLLEDEAE